MLSSHSAGDSIHVGPSANRNHEQPPSALTSLSRESILESVPLILPRIRLARLDPPNAYPFRALSSYCNAN